MLKDVSPTVDRGLRSTGEEDLSEPPQSTSDNGSVRTRPVASPGSESADSSGNMVRNGESDFESRGFTYTYKAGYISVQRVGSRSMSKPKIYTMTFAKVYPLYVAKAERKDRTKAEVDEIIRWLTGYDQLGLEARLK